MNNLGYSLGDWLTASRKNLLSSSERARAAEILKQTGNSNPTADDTWIFFADESLNQRVRNCHSPLAKIVGTVQFLGHALTHPFYWTHNLFADYDRSSPHDPNETRAGYIKKAEQRINERRQPPTSNITQQPEW